MSYFTNLTFVNIDRRSEKCTDSPLIHNIHYSIEYLKEGSMFLFTNGKKRKLTAPSAFWMLPGNTYQFVAANQDLIEHLWADFYGPRAEQMLKSIHERIPAGTIQITRNHEFEAVFSNMVQVYHQAPLNKRYEAIVGLERLAGIIFASTTDINAWKNPRDDFFLELAEEMKAYPMEDYDFRKIARQNKLSYHYFRKLFKQLNHFAPNDYLICCRMEHAAQIMKQQDVNISEVAELCGFSALSSFSRLFKRKTGTSPKDYIQTVRKRIV